MVGDRAHGKETHEVEVDEEIILEEVDEAEGEMNTMTTTMEDILREMTIFQGLVSGVMNGDTRRTSAQTILSNNNIRKDIRRMKSLWHIPNATASPQPKIAKDPLTLLSNKKMFLEMQI